MNLLIEYIDLADLQLLPVLATWSLNRTYPNTIMATTGAADFVAAAEATLSQHR